MVEDSEKQAHARVGCVLDDKWTLERLLGMGGMAAVYAARHRNGARAAVKVLHADLSRHKEVRDRFLREGYAANRVEHVGAVKVLDDDVVVSGPESGTAYLVMELLEGESLQDRLEHGPPMTELEFLAIAGSVLDVLEAAHSRGVIHRDLKPENLFLPRPGGAVAGDKVKVLDFGLARLLLHGHAITSYGLALGTPSFMSPEQAAGRIDEIDGRTDLFALAATGFRVCTGQRIHEAQNPVELVRKMASVAAPRVRTLHPEMSAAFARVIDRALEFRREDRYESAAAMREDVKRAVAELEASGPTQLALEPPPSLELGKESSDEQATVELEERDLRAPSRPSMPSTKLLGEEESVRLPRRRSSLSWVVLIAALLVLGALWLRHLGPGTVPDGRAIALDPMGTSVPEAAAALAPAAMSVQAPWVVRDGDAGADASEVVNRIPFAQPVAAGPLSRPSVQPKPAGKIGPGNVHKLPRKHRSNKAHAKGTPAQ